MSSPSRRLLPLLCAWALTACGSLPKPPPVEVPASLRQPCPPLQPPADGSGAAVLRTMVEWAGQYRECADRHGRLVEALGQRSSSP